ncbi:MAG TPA: OmpA family protein [Rhodocyclaceae bacterium]
MIGLHNIPAGLRLAPVAAAALLLAACATATKPEGADRVRAELTTLQTNPDYASRAPVALQDAEAAVRIAEVPTEDKVAGAQAVYVAERKVAIARAQADKRIAEDKRKGISEAREAIRLDARTAEAEAAKAQAQEAMAAAQREQLAAQQAQQAAMAARAEAEELRRQMEDLQAKQTDRGLVMTLGDVLFATGKAELKAGSEQRLDKLVAFLAKYPDRSIIVEGHTDSSGSDATNLALSQRRADAVRAYLLTRGVAASRVMAVGKGESLPVADNGTPAGRQQNRRVEIVISNVAS